MHAFETQRLKGRFAATDTPLPALFVGHGNPMNAIEENEFSRAWAAMGARLPRPDGILSISAHWETGGTRVTAMELPETIHDFFGFPQELFDVQYPAPGSLALAELVGTTLSDAAVQEDFEWGLDHGTWSVLRRMFPNADIPVVQLSLDRRLAPEDHYRLGRALRPLRRKGVLIIGSGNMVHNLPAMVWKDTAFDWALEFDRQLAALIQAGKHAAVVDYEQLGAAARKAVPTREHFLPLLYVLGLQEENEEVSFFAEKVTLGSISMRALRLG